jgi:Cell division control protein 14, SIN component
MFSVKILEFLYFYLIPEPILPKSPSSTAVSNGSSSSSSSGSDSSASSTGTTTRKIIRRTTEEKKGMVGKLLGGEKGVEGLVRDLKEFRPFGDIG